jgi:hypothetical protein
MGTWRCYAKGNVANLPIQRLRMEPMGRNDSLTPLRYESAAQEKRTERAAERQEHGPPAKDPCEEASRTLSRSLDSSDQTCQLSSYSRRSAGENQTSDRCFCISGRIVAADHSLKRRLQTGLHVNRPPGLKAFAERLNGTTPTIKVS